MSKLMSARDFQHEIAEIEAMLRVHAELDQEHGPDPAAAAMAHALVARRDALRAEMEERGDGGMPGQNLDVTFSGRPVVGNTIPTLLLGEILIDLQRMVAQGVRNALGTVGRLATIPEAAMLRAAPATAGSFRLHLEAGPMQDSFFPPEESGPLHQTVAAVVQFMDAEATEEDVLSAASTLGAPAVESGREILKRIAKSGAEMEVCWPTTSGAKRSFIATRSAGKRLRSLRQVQVRTRTLVATGRLDGALVRRGYFEFLTDDGEVYSGSVNPGLKAEIETYFNKPCRALLHVTESHDDVTGRNSKKYRLDRLADLGVDMFGEESSG